MREGKFEGEKGFGKLILDPYYNQRKLSQLRLNIFFGMA